jgi:hypothetical protein
MPYTAEISRANPSCFLFLIDQSGSMARMGVLVAAAWAVIVLIVQAPRGVSGVWYVITSRLPRPTACGDSFGGKRTDGAIRTSCLSRCFVGGLTVLPPWRFLWVCRNGD